MRHAHAAQRLPALRVQVRVQRQVQALLRDGFERR